MAESKHHSAIERNLRELGQKIMETSWKENNKSNEKNSQSQKNDINSNSSIKTYTSYNHVKLQSSTNEAKNNSDSLLIAALIARNSNLSINKS
ncbi:MAG: hypothetical protein JW841_11730 [Deltaproteobacteria bacterium]|nr:hypothetical protein [Deltaproteobacteria bacterium]